MGKMIRLTLTCGKGPTWVSVDHVTEICAGDQNTYVHLATGGKDGYSLVRETPAEILALIEGSPEPEDASVVGEPGTVITEAFIAHARQSGAAEKVRAYATQDPDGSNLDNALVDGAKVVLEYLGLEALPEEASDA